MWKAPLRYKVPIINPKGEANLKTKTQIAGRCPSGVSTSFYSLLIPSLGNYDRRPLTVLSPTFSPLLSPAFSPLLKCTRETGHFSKQGSLTGYLKNREPDSLNLPQQIPFYLLFKTSSFISSCEQSSKVRRNRNASKQYKKEAPDIKRQGLVLEYK